MQGLYNFSIYLLVLGMKIAGAFSYKVKRGLAGRRQSCNSVKSKLTPADCVIWMHAASLGEYEQGLPVLERLKMQYPDHKILITFFSPSGYENVIKKKHPADVVCYLPFDREKWILEFTSNFTTSIFFTVKYDYWYNLLAVLKRSDARVYVVSAFFYEKQAFFKLYGKWFQSQLRQHVDWFFHQNKNSAALAKTIGLNQSSTSGDTRFDRVKKLKKQDADVPFVSEFINGRESVVIGSSWEAEERIAQMLSRKKDLKIIIAPHDLKRVSQLQTIFPKALLYSQMEHLSVRHNAQVLIIDSIGLLSKLYSYATFALVGGGFHTAGLHNILEAAVYGKPVFFGNHYRKNPEADALVRLNGGKALEDEFYAANYLLKLLENPELLMEMGKNAGDFVASQPVATDIVMRKITADVPPTAG